MNNVFVGDTQIKWALKADPLFALGAFLKDQQRSASEILFEQHPPTDPQDIPKDNFDFSSYALYAQYSYLWGESLELALALRADHINLGWSDLSRSIRDTILAPRFQILHITHHRNQRLSYGLGYRAPLTFLEFQPGNNEFDRLHTWGPHTGR